MYIGTTVIYRLSFDVFVIAYERKHELDIFYNKDTVTLKHLGTYSAQRAGQRVGLLSK